MAAIDVMREFVSKQYTGKWPERVKLMPDNQVMAIYHSMIEAIEREKNSRSEPRLRVTEVYGGEQLSFFEEWGRKPKIKEEYVSGYNDETDG